MKSLDAMFISLNSLGKLKCVIIAITFVFSVDVEPSQRKENTESCYGVEPSQGKETRNNGEQSKIQD